MQVNGKVKHRFQAEAGLPAEALIAVTKAEPEVIALLHGKPSSGRSPFQVASQTSSFGSAVRHLAI